MDKQFKYRAKCLKCGHEDSVVKETKEECKTIDVCPSCGDGAYVDLFYYHRYKKKDDRSKLNINATLDIDTDKMQLKLRAISKHAESLANELDRIDNLEPCNKCGGFGTESIWMNEELHTTKCAECGHVIYQRQ